MDRVHLRELMTQMGVTQMGLASLIGVHQGQLSKVLNGKHDLGSRAAERCRELAKAHAPDLHERAVRLETLMEAYRSSPEVRKIVDAALKLMHENA